MSVLKRIDAINLHKLPIVIYKVFFHYRGIGLFNDYEGHIVNYQMWEMMVNRWPELVNRLPFDEYDSGFKYGYENALPNDPFLDQMDLKIKIVKTATQFKGFPMSGVRDKYFDHKAIYDYGVYMGRQYFYWLKITEYPESFEQIFKERVSLSSCKSVEERTKKVSSSSNQEVVKQIAFIKPDLIIKVLTPFATNKDRLNDIINDKLFEEPILLKLNANQLAEFFKRVQYNKGYVGYKKDLIKWIASSFKYFNTTSKQFQSIKESTLKQVILKGKSIPSETKRIGNEEFAYDPTTKKY